MSKYKICVYAICKNESKFAKRWYESMSEADYVCVLDTGSEDNSYEIFKDLGAITKRKIFSKWRFDDARNASMRLIPKDTDICVCTDIDEVFEKGWRKKLEEAWSDETERLRYRYVWSFGTDGKEDVVFLADKIHKRGKFFWKYPVHEILTYKNGKKYCTECAEDLTLYHYADNEKSRSSYLALLELSVIENKNDDRNMHYLGREYYFHGKYEKSIDTLKRHLEMKSATWLDERCASMRYIAKSYVAMNDVENAILWYMEAIICAPYLREPYIELASLLLEKNEFYGAIYFVEKALKITKRNLNYISRADVWSALPYDILSVAYFYIGMKELSLEYAEKSFLLSPKDKRIEENVKIIKSSIANEKSS